MTEEQRIKEGLEMYRMGGADMCDTLTAIFQEMGQKYPNLSTKAVLILINKAKQNTNRNAIDMTALATGIKQSARSH